MAARDIARNPADRDRPEDKGGWPARAGRDPALPDREAFYARQGYGPGDYAGRGVSGPAADAVTDWYGGEATGQVRPDLHVRARDQRGKGPKGYRRRDDRIQEDLSDRLTDDAWIDASEIEVRVENGEVTLTGTVSDRNTRRRVEDLAESVPGVAHVQNNLRISRPEPGGAGERSGGASGDVERGSGITGTTATASSRLGGTASGDVAGRKEA